MSGHDSAEATAVRPFTVDIPEADLEDLRARIAATRWPEKETVDDASQGVQPATAAGGRALLARRVRLARVRGEAERRPAVRHRDRRAGQQLRPLRSKHEDALPLHACPEWPGSFIER